MPEERLIETVDDACAHWRRPIGSLVRIILRLRRNTRVSLDSALARYENRRVEGLLTIFVGLISWLGFAQRPAVRVALYAQTTDKAAFAHIQAMLAATAMPPAVANLQDDWDPYALVIMIRPPVPQPVPGTRINFAQKVGTYYLRGGRILLVDVPGAGGYPNNLDLEIWDNLTRYLWDIPLHDISGNLEDSDGRALFFPGAANLGSVDDFKATLTRLLAAQDVLPEQVPAEDFGPAPPIALRDNALLVADKPVLLRGVSEYDLLQQVPMREHEARLHAYHELGLNLVEAYTQSDIRDESVRQFLEIARRNGIYVELQLRWPLDVDEPVQKKALLKFLRFRNHPMFIGWEFSDDMLDAYFPFVQRAVEIVRRYDHRQLMTGVFMDARRPEKVGNWEKWKKLMDFPYTYLFPLQKDPATLGVKGDIAGGFKDIDRLTQNARRMWGDVFQEQALQAHMQGVLAETVGLKPWSEHLIPTADQQRLMTYRAALSGVKGITYFYPNALDDEGMGRNRRCELGIAWHELALVEDLLAAGRPPVQLRTSDPAVDASQIHAGSQSVILAVKDQPYYNRYVDQAEVAGLTVDLDSSTPAEASVYQLGWPRLKQLELKNDGGRRWLKLERFALTALLLVTNDRRRVGGIQQQFDKDLPLTAGYALDVLADEQVKTEVVATHLPADLQGNGALLKAGKAALERAQRAHSEKDMAVAYQEARAGLLPLEEYRSQALRAAVKDADARHASPSVRVYLNIYFSLPLYAHITRGGSTLAAGQLRKEMLEAEGQTVWNYIDRVVH